MGHNNIRDVALEELLHPGPNVSNQNRIRLRRALLSFNNHLLYTNTYSYSENVLLIGSFFYLSAIVKISGVDDLPLTHLFKYASKFRGICL